MRTRNEPGARQEWARSAPRRCQERSRRGRALLVVDLHRLAVAVSLHAVPFRLLRIILPEWCLHVHRRGLRASTRRASSQTASFRCPSRRNGGGRGDGIGRVGLGCAWRRDARRRGLRRADPILGAGGVKGGDEARVDVLSGLPAVACGTIPGRPPPRREVDATSDVAKAVVVDSRGSGRRRGWL